MNALRWSISGVWLIFMMDGWEGSYCLSLWVMILVNILMVIEFNLILPHQIQS